MQEKDGPKLLGPHSGGRSRVANMQGPMLLEPICPHELPSPLDVFRVPWLRSQLPLLLLLRSTPWPSELGGSLSPFTDEKTERWVGHRAPGGCSKPVGVGQGAQLPWL